MTAGKTERARATLLTAVLTLVLSPACVGPPPVARVVDGHDIDGHYIEPEAYAEYLDGALLEARGDLNGAEAAYERALDMDPAAEIWARLGRVRCRTSQRASNDAFDRAKRRGKNIGPVWLADAECALSRGELPRALRSAERAAALEPGNAQASLLVVRALMNADDEEGAQRWLRAARLLYPEAAGVPASLAAVPRVDEGTLPASVAPAMIREAPPEKRDREAMAAVDAAIVADDGARAKAAAVAARLGIAALALRAVELGRPAFAKELSEVALTAEPGNVDARIAALAAADLAHDDAELRRLATKLPDPHDRPSAAAIRVMVGLLHRRVGEGAAASFVRAFGAEQAASAAPPRAQR